MKVKVLDAIMGSGKTQRLISDVSKLANPVIYITPLLSECHRFAGTVLDENGVVVRRYLRQNHVFSSTKTITYKHFYYIYYSYKKCL